MLSDIRYFFILGTMQLIFMTYKDFKNKMLVDDRYNFFMTGVAISLYSHVGRNIYYILAVIALVLTSNILFRRIKSYGVGDINSISWIVLGLAIGAPSILFVFALNFLVLGLIYQISKSYLMKIKQATPFYFVILLSFVSTSLLTGAY